MGRFRTFSDETTSRSYREYWWSNQPAYDFDRTVLRTRVRRYDRMLDVVTPKFDKIRNKGGILCNPMYHAEVYHDVDETVVNYQGHAGSWPWKGENHFDLGLGASPVGELLLNGSTTAFDTLFEKFETFESLAITRAHADVDISEMQLLATVGELPETLNWIKSLIERAIKVTRAFHSKAERANILRTLLYSAEEASSPKAIKHATRRYEAFVQLLKKRAERNATKVKGNVVDDFSSLWLEYRYAVRPLIVDIQNALKALDTVIKSRRLTARGHEYSVGKWENRTTANAILGGTFPVMANATVKTEESIRARAGCLYAVEESVASLATILGIDQPIESMYELIPFSFILDWFFSIGDLLQSYFKSSGLDILTSWVTCEFIRKESTKINEFRFSGTNYFIVDSYSVVEKGSSNSTVQLKRRLANPAMPLLPRFDLKLSLAKIIDLGMIGRALTGSQLSEVTKRSLKHA